MKVIDLLNKIANGEEVPKKIKYDNKTYIFNNHNGYLDSLDNNIGYYHILDACLNDEVEIIEEDKKIEKIHKIVPSENYIIADKSRNIEDRLEIIRKRLYDNELYMSDMCNSINEIIDYINKGDKE